MIDFSDLHKSVDPCRVKQLKELLKIIIDDYGLYSSYQPWELGNGYTNKDAFEFRYIDGMEYKDICLLMGINLAQLRRGIRLFRGDLLRSSDVESLIKRWNRDKKINEIINV